MILYWRVIPFSTSRLSPLISKGNTLCYYLSRFKIHGKVAFTMKTIINELVFALSAIIFLNAGSACINIHEPQIPSQAITKQAPKLHNIPISEIHSNSAYWNLSWQGRYPEMEKKVKDISQQYFKTHTYITGQTDCNDMAIDIWNMLQTAFSQCNHAWLLVYEKRDNSGPASFAVETTNGQIYFSNDTANRYWTGFCYIKPSDLRDDLKERW
jgi:hypothetical protein